MGIGSRRHGHNVEEEEEEEGSKDDEGGCGVETEAVGTCQEAK